MEAAEGESMVAAEGEPMVVAAREWSCTVRDCECSWLYLPQIPRVTPTSDCIDGIPAGADPDPRPAWSLLVGVRQGDGASSSVRVSRLRVARSGRILGRGDDKLDIFHDIVPAKPLPHSLHAAAAAAALAPDGRSLCVLCKYDREQPQALQLQLDTTRELPLPEIQGTQEPCIPISAAGHIWALSATEHLQTFTVVTRRLDATGRWEQVGEPFTSPLIHHRFPDWGGWFLQGYAVLPGGKLILVSFQQYGLFLTFAPHSGCWTRVDTDRERSEDYLPIKGRAIYMEQHDAVYMLWENTIYAYKLIHKEDDQGTELLSLQPPVEVDLVCPFTLDKGYGFLTRLDDRLLCSVWISLAMHDRCPCDNLHAIVTTFHLRDKAHGGIGDQAHGGIDDQAHGGIDVLHSTYRRVDMLPCTRHQAEFCFLQEYEDEGSSALLLQHQEEQEDSSQHVSQPSKILSCCRARRESLLIKLRCKECVADGHTVWQCTEMRERSISTILPLGQSHSLPVDLSFVTVNPVTTTIKKDLFIICQAGSQSVIFQTGAMDDHDKPLQTCYVPDGGDLHFFQNGSKIYAISCIGDGMREFSLNKDWTTDRRSVRQPANPFIMVIRVGGETIALTDTLQVFHQTKYTRAPTSWLAYKTKGDVVYRKVLISGYVVVNDDSFIVCDAVTRLWFLFRMGAKQWRVVMPWAAFEEDLPRTDGLLNGRCVFVDGFIYTCRNGGLAAYELVGEGGCVYISNPIFLPFSWHADCVGENMCLDYAGKDKESGAILFYVVQSAYSPPKHPVQITTVKVKTKRRARNKMIPAGIDYVVSVTRFLRHRKAIHKKGINTRCCFAV